MGNYSNDPEVCRVDFFKESGKYYTTEAIRFVDGTWEAHPRDALKMSLREQLGERLSDMTAVCLDPYVKDSFPVMVREW
jgi:hypothetical protein